jgi:hypothetical protein
VSLRPAPLTRRATVLDFRREGNAVGKILEEPEIHGLRIYDAGNDRGAGNAVGVLVDNDAADGRLNEAGDERSGGVGHKVDTLTLARFDFECRMFLARVEKLRWVIRRTLDNEIK